MFPVLQVNLTAIVIYHYQKEREKSDCACMHVHALSVPLFLSVFRVPFRFLRILSVHTFENE